MLHDTVLAQFPKMLQNLSLFLDKAAAYADSKKVDTGVLLGSRLAPDQFPLLRQIQIACDTAKNGAAYLTGKAAPSHDDQETTLADAKARIAKVIEHLGTFTVKDFTGAETRRVSQPRWAGKSLSGSEYAEQHMIPNFYFHVTTAYAILRHNGVDLGKKDYLGAMPFADPTGT